MGELFFRRDGVSNQKWRNRTTKLTGEYDAPQFNSSGRKPHESEQQRMANEDKPSQEVEAGSAVETELVEAHEGIIVRQYVVFNDTKNELTITLELTGDKTANFYVPHSPITLSVLPRARVQITAIMKRDPTAGWGQFEEKVRFQTGLEVTGDAGKNGDSSVNKNNKRVGFFGPVAMDDIERQMLQRKCITCETPNSLLSDHCKHCGSLLYIEDI
eukprot:TRINITY_DN9446_c0_g1_i3.p1 TRINITY_DN9446_c0_g1~~TRINITY_DN9446_c0_g1_i3.p1  ORF type:complete len:226 (+),score=64.55 TRINITY_DN9446_c0_g1_i3:35-679(+)